MQHFFRHWLELRRREETGAEDGTPTYTQVTAWAGSGLLDTPTKHEPKEPGATGRTLYTALCFAPPDFPGQEDDELWVTDDLGHRLLWQIDHAALVGTPLGTHHVELKLKRVKDSA